MIVKIAAPNFKKSLYAESLKQASDFCTLFIEATEITSEQWEGGQVLSDDGKEIANIAYNRHERQGNPRHTCFRQCCSKNPRLDQIRAQSPHQRRQRQEGR
jgi:hypothetical protein